MKRIWKKARWPVIAITILFIIALTFNAALIKYLINNYSEEYSGRRITVEDVRFNLFNGNIRLIELNIKEQDGSSDFIDIARFELDLSIYKLWLGDVQLTSFDIIEPRISIVQHGSHFNFSDLIDRFSTDSLVSDTTVEDPLWFELVDLNVDNGRLAYSSDLVEEDLVFEDLFLNVDTVASYRSIINAALKMDVGWGGKIDATFHVDQADSTYLTNIRSIGTKLSAFKVYVDPYMNIKELNGELNSDLTISGNFNDNLGIALKGTVGINEFGLIDPKGIALTSVGECVLNIDTIDVRSELYNVHSLKVRKPYLFYEQYVETDNFADLNVYDSTEVSEEVLELGYDPSNPFSLLAHYAKEVANSYKDGSFRLDSVDISDGHLVYNDYSMYDVFNYELTALHITSHDINSKEKEFVVNIHSKLNEVGSLEAELKFDPNSSRNMQLDYVFENVVMPNFGPYSLFYTALPILSGETKYTCHTVIADNKVESSNHVFIEDFNYGKKNKNIKDAYSLPLRFAVSLLKDANGNIDIEIPIEGDLDDPDYKIGKVVWKMVKNMVTKAASAPYKALSRTFSVDEDDLKNVNFLYLQNNLDGAQKKPLNTISRVLESKPEMYVEIVQCGDKELEMNKYAVYMSKVKYFEHLNGVEIDPLDPQIMDEVLAINSKDSLFNVFLDDQLALDPQMPVQLKCEKYIGREKSEAGVNERWALRNALITGFLKDEKELATSSFVVRDVNPQDTIISAGPPKYQVIYSIKEGQQ